MRKKTSIMLGIFVWGPFKSNGSHCSRRPFGIKFNKPYSRASGWAAC